MTTTTIRDLRANMKAYFDAVENDSEVLLVPRQGEKEAMVIMTLSEYNGLVETEYLLGSEENRKMFDEAKSELEAGDSVNFVPSNI